MPYHGLYCDAPKDWMDLCAKISKTLIKQMNSRLIGQTAVDRDDLLNEGMLAGIRAKPKYDKVKGAPSTFLQHVIHRRFQTVLRQVDKRRDKDRIYADKSGVASVLLDPALIAGRISVFVEHDA